MSQTKKNLNQLCQQIDTVALVCKLCERDIKLDGNGRACPCGRPLPRREIISKIVDDLRCVLFPSHYSHSDQIIEHSSKKMRTQIDSLVESLYPIIKEQMHRAFCYTGIIEKDENCKDRSQKAQSVTDAFFEALPTIQKLLKTDVQAAYDGDPAVTNNDEIILCYPGLLAITNYRLAHELYKLGVPYIPRMMTELAHSQTGIDIHPGATVGESFFIDHGTGVVIGETCTIGNKVRIYQGVTLGAKSFPLDNNGKPIKNVKRHPIVEDNVIIYSEATILGRVTIGRGSIIGGNVCPPGKPHHSGRSQTTVI